MKIHWLHKGQFRRPVELHCCSTTFYRSNLLDLYCVLWCEVSCLKRYLTFNGRCSGFVVCMLRNRANVVHIIYALASANPSFSFLRIGFLFPHLGSAANLLSIDFFCGGNDIWTKCKIDKMFGVLFIECINRMFHVEREWLIRCAIMTLYDIFIF